MLLLAVAGVVVFTVPSVRGRVTGWYGSRSTKKDSRFLTKEAKQAPFRIVVTEQGTLDSLRNATLKSTVEGNTAILSIVPEGVRVFAPVPATIGGVVSLKPAETEASRIVTVTGDDNVPVDHDVFLHEFTEVLVKEGDLVEAGDLLVGDVVCELDSSALVDKEKQQHINVTQSTASVEKSISNVQIQAALNESALETARLDEKLAELDLRKYQEGEYIQTRNQIRGEIKQIEEDLAIAQEDYEFVRRVARRGYKSQNDLEAARIKVLKQQLLLDAKRGELRVLEDFTYERTMSELEQMAADTKRETGRTQLEGEAAIAQFIAAKDADALTHDVEVAKLEKLRRQIRACRLVAPQDGEVIYANVRRRRGEPTIIEEGAIVYERQAIITLPDLTRMKVDARIHESKISSLREGLLVEIDVEALPRVAYHGVLETISSIPVPGSWPNFDLKEYEAEIRITDGVEKVAELKPGMTAEIRIIVQDRTDDVLQIPVQSVVSLANRQFAWVLNGDRTERRSLRLGATNDEAVEILDGVEAGETVILNARSHFSQELNELELRLLAEHELKSAGPDRRGAARPNDHPRPGGGPGARRPGAGAQGTGARGARRPPGAR